MYKLDIVIVNWNAGEHLLRCIESLVESGSHEFCNIIVVDNDSSDSSLNLIKKYSSIIKIHCQKENLGFAKACNHGAKLGDSEYILFLNPDVVLKKETIVETLKFYKDKENLVKLGIVGVRLYNTFGIDSISCSRFPKYYHFIAQAIGLHKIFPSISPLMKSGCWDKPTIVDEVTGAYYFISRATFNKLSGFDEQFFVYYEETDLCYRLAEADYVSYILPHISAIHYGGGCSESNRPISLFYNIRSRLCFFKKNHGVFEYRLVFLTTFFVEIPIRLLRAFRNRAQFVEMTQLFRRLWREMLYYEK